MKTRSIYLRSVADPTKHVQTTGVQHGSKLQVGPSKQAFTAFLMGNKWGDGQRVMLGVNEDLLVLAPGDGGQLQLHDRFGSPFTIRHGVDNSWALVATGSPVSLRVGRSDYHGDDVGQVRTLDPTAPILDWESFEVIDASTGKVLGPF